MKNIQAVIEAPDVLKENALHYNSKIGQKTSVTGDEEHLAGKTGRTKLRGFRYY